MQEGHEAAHSQGDKQPARRCRSDSMHEMRIHGHCLDWTTKCQSMNLNARCAKSVLKWISQSMTKANQSAAGKT